jgi:predicted RNase H-like HicB family nuclease
MANSAKKRTIWMGTIPEIFGYGLSVVGETREECEAALKKGYREWTKNSAYSSDDYGDMRDKNGKKLTRFEKAMEYWGGSVFQVELGKIYYDDFKD